MTRCEWNVAKCTCEINLPHVYSMLTSCQCILKEICHLFNVIITFLIMHYIVIMTSNCLGGPRFSDRWAVSALHPATPNIVLFSTTPVKLRAAKILKTLTANIKFEESITICNALYRIGKKKYFENVRKYCKDEVVAYQNEFNWCTA